MYLIPICDIIIPVIHSREIFLVYLYIYNKSLKVFMYVYIIYIWLLINMHLNINNTIYAQNRSLNPNALGNGIIME